MRIDRYLFFIRLAKSRTLAQSIIEKGHVRIDGRRVAKPSEEVKVGHVVALPIRDQVRIIRVLNLPARRGPVAEAQSTYEVIDA